MGSLFFDGEIIVIVYHADSNIDLLKYGIEVPLLETRAKNIVHEVKNKKSITVPNYAPRPEALTYDDLCFAHEPEYVEKLFGQDSVEREIVTAYELYDSEGNPNRYNPASSKNKLEKLFLELREQAAMSYTTMELALSKGFAYFLGGGMHHAMSFGGRGFCLINDIVIGIRKLQSRGLLKEAWVIDVDAHKGDGTAEITYHDPSISTLSIHMAQGWPLGTEERDASGNLYPWHYPSTVDVPIFPGEEKNYLEKLKNGIKRLKEKSKLPDLVVINQGADPFENDELPSTESMRISEDDLLKRDIYLEEIFESMGVPRAYLMSGGYGDESYRIYSNFLTTLDAKKLV